MLSGDIFLLLVKGRGDIVTERKEREGVGGERERRRRNRRESLSDLNYRKGGLTTIGAVSGVALSSSFCFSRSSIVFFSS